MKLSNQNICNLRGFQMPLGGVQIISGGVRTPPENPCLVKPLTALIRFVNNSKKRHEK
jgi:hypothetical protein